MSLAFDLSNMPAGLASLGDAEDPWRDPATFDRMMAGLRSKVQKADSESWKNDRCKWKTTNASMRTQWSSYMGRIGTLYGKTGKQAEKTLVFNVSTTFVSQLRALWDEWNKKWVPWFQKSCFEGGIVAGTTRVDHTRLVIEAADIQRIEKALGAPWQTLAAQRNLPTTYIKRPGNMVEVSTQTYGNLGPAAVRAGAPLPKPGTVYSQPSYTPEPPGSYPAGSITQPISSLQAIVVALGQRAPGTALTDGTWGPTTAKAWKAEAAKRSLSTYIERVSSSKARVNMPALTTLRSAAQTAPAPVPAGPIAVKPPAPIPAPPAPPPIAPAPPLPPIIPQDGPVLPPLAPIAPKQAGMFGNPLILGAVGMAVAGVYLLSRRG